MHGFCARLAAGLDDLVDQQIAFSGGRRSDQDGFIGHFDMERITVRFGIDRDGLHPHAAGGLDDAAGDLAAICDQDSLEHVLVCLATLGGGNLARRVSGNNSVVQ